jgi:hypothetical protein
MRPLVLAVLLVSTPASAQSTSPSRTGRALVGIAASAGTPFVLYHVVSDEAAIAGAVVAPLVAAVAVHYLGTDRSGRFDRTLGGAALGLLPSVVIFGATAVVTAATCSDFCIPVYGLAAGTVAYAVGPAVGAALRYRSAPQVQPVVLRGPDGGRAPGLALRFAL